MVENTNRSSFGEVRYTDSDYEMTGDFRQDTSTNDVMPLNLSVNRKNGWYIYTSLSLAERQHINAYFTWYTDRVN